MRNSLSSGLFERRLRVRSRRFKVTMAEVRQLIANKHVAKCRTDEERIVNESRFRTTSEFRRQDAEHCLCKEWSRAMTVKEVVIRDGAEDSLCIRTACTSLGDEPRLDSDNDEQAQT